MNGADLTKERWNDFLENVVHDAGRDDERPAEADKPGCNDAPDPDDGAPTIVSRFWTDATMDELARFVDPRNWVELGSPYWLHMDPVRGPVPEGRGGYHATFREVVLLPSGRMTVYLDVRFTRAADFALTEYWVSPLVRDQPVTIDEGCVLATTRTSPPGALPNLVYSTKTIEFTDAALNEFTDLACDNGWVDLMIRMALPPARRPVPSPKLRRGDPIDRWETSLNELVTAHVSATREVIDALRAGDLERAVDGVLSCADGLAGAAEVGVTAARHAVGQLAGSDEGS